MRAVLDPNVLVSSQLSPNGTPARLLSLAERGRYEMIVSESLTEEIRNVLARSKFRRYLPEEAIPPAILRIRNAATLAEEGEVERRLEDPKDDYLVELALAAHADVIVSGDRHLHNPPRELPVRVVRPADFLAELENNSESG